MSTHFPIPYTDSSLKATKISSKTLLDITITALNPLNLINPFQ